MVRRTFFTAAILTLAAASARAQLNDTEAKTVTGDDTQRAPTTQAANSHPVLPPKWTFGVLYGTYYDQPKILDAMQHLRNGYCGDLLWIDSSWLSGDYTDKGQNHYINFTFDPGQFPDPKTMIATLRQNHFHFGVWQWPFIEKSITPLYTYGEQNHLFVTDQKGGEGNVVNGGGWHGVKFSGQFDFTNPKAVDWYVQLNKPLTDMGLDFLKIDTYSTVPKGGVAFDGSPSDVLREGYHKAAYEVTQGGDSNKRGFYLAHHNPTPNNDQYPGMWTGDVKTTWPGFEADMKIAAGLNTPQTAAYWCSDTGGYNGDVDGDELYIRWLQYGTFCPINEFFAAKNTKGRFPWIFSEDGQRNFKFYTQLRYRLLPFRYSNAQIAYHETPTKYPVRFVEGTTDEILVGNGDSELLVAPIHVKGATSREVHLPAGTWINYWTEKPTDGPSVVTVDAPLDQVPLFVKGGSIIPMGPDMQYVDEKIADPVTLNIYPTFAKSSYAFYEDDGTTTDYQQGKFSRTLLSFDITQTVAVNIGKSIGEYSGKLPTRKWILEIHRMEPKPLSVTNNNKPLAELATQQALNSADQGWFYDQKSNVAWVTFSSAADAESQVILTFPKP